MPVTRKSFWIDLKVQSDDLPKKEAEEGSGDNQVRGTKIGKRIPKVKSDMPLTGPMKSKKAKKEISKPPQKRSRRTT